MRPLALLFAGALLDIALTSPVFSADLPAASEPPPLTLGDSWRFQATVYGWGVNLNGDVGVGRLPTVSVDVSFADVLQNLDGALMGNFYATNGQWTIITDLIWSKLSKDVQLPFGGTAEFEQRQAILSGVVGYRLPFGPPNFSLSATAGARYNHLKGEVNVSPAILPITISRDATVDWVDPTVGLFMRYDINDRWFVNVLGDVGGFNVSSKITSQGFASIGYKWTKSFSTAVGFRAIYTDYDRGGLDYKATEYGPYVGFGLHF